MPNHIASIKQKIEMRAEGGSDQQTGQEKKGETKRGKP
jgi:hypothetical protein